MALVLQRFFNGYADLMAQRDVRSIHLPMAGSSMSIVMLLTGYLLFVLRLGPQFMENRKPYDLKNIIRGYNLLQVTANGLLFLYIIIKVYIVYGDFDFRCQPCNYSSDYRGYEEMYVSYGYFLLKVTDLADTVFFVLRKKQSHVSFLHVYHHTLMVIATYCALMYVPGGHVIMLGIWNTLVHTVMYFYYFLSSYSPRNGIWWKKSLTRLQLLQFIHLAYHFGRPLFFDSECAFSRFWLWVGFLQAIIVLVLFLDFYIKSYIVKRKN